MAETTQDIITRVEGILARKAKDAGPATYQKAHWLAFIADAYWKISRLLKTPRKTNTATTTTSGDASYDIPTDILGGLKGIISIQWNSIPVAKGSRRHLMADYHDKWKSPDGMEACSFWVPGATDAEILLIPGPTSAKTLEYEYVERVAEPTNTSYTDTVHYVFEEFIPDIALYVAGRAMELDRQGRGAAIIGEFEARILRTSRLQKRESGYQIREGRYAKLDAYHRRFRGR